jgi:hypothetical protein
MAVCRLSRRGGDIKRVMTVERDAFVILMIG